VSGKCSTCGALGAFAGFLSVAKIDVTINW
jgi:hypothetical protein